MGLFICVYAQMYNHTASARSAVAAILIIGTVTSLMSVLVMHVAKPMQVGGSFCSTGIICRLTVFDAIQGHYISGSSSSSTADQAAYI